MARDILIALIEANLAASAAIMLVLVLRAPVRRWFGARTAYALWLAPLAAALATFLPAARWPSAPVEPIAAPGVAAAPTQAAAPILPRLDFPAMADSAPLLSHADIVLAIWAAGLVGMIALLAWRQGRSVSALGALAREDAGVLRSTRAGVGPVLIGAMWPRIVVPADFETRFDPEERSLILAHERAHLSAGDAQINALIALSTCLCWFNPLAHLAAHLARLDQELACDAAVLARFPTARKRYAEALIKTQLAGFAIPLGCAWPARTVHPLKQRIKLLGAAAPNALQRVAGGAAVAMLCCAGAAAAWAAQPAANGATSLVTASAQSGAEALLQHIAATDPSPAGVFDARTIELTGIAALLQVIPESRSDIAVSVTRGARLEAPTARLEGDRLIIDGGLGESANDCSVRFNTDGATRLRGIGALRARELPVVILRTPHALNLRIRGAVVSHVGASAGGVVLNESCGDARIEAASGPLTVGLYGFGNVDVAPVSGALTADLYGIGDLSVDRADGDTALVLQGVGDLNVGPVRGALDARLGGTGDLIVGNVGRGALLALPGSGRMRVGDIRGALDLAVSGSGPVRVDSVRGARLTTTVTGSSQLAVGDGAVDEMIVSISGSADVSFAGRAERVRADFSGGRGDVRVGEAGSVDTRRSNGGHGEVVVTGR